MPAPEKVDIIWSSGAVAVAVVVVVMVVTNFGEPKNASPENLCPAPPERKKVHAAPSRVCGFAANTS